MTAQTRKWIDASAAILMLLAGIYIMFFVFPNQLPRGLRGDASAGFYPRSIMAVWLAAATIWLFRSAVLNQGQDDLVEIPDWKRTLIIAAAALAGYLLFAYVGFIVAAFFIIVVLSHLAGERGWVPWVLGLTVPFCVYFFLLKVLEVRLPSAILG